MATPELPSDFIHEHFPGAGRGVNSVESNGSDLILRNIKINRIYYDLRIQRWDANGELITINENTDFMVASIKEIEKSAIKLFSELDDPTKYRYWFHDVGEQKFRQEEIHNPDLKERMTELEKDTKLFNSIKEIHDEYFNVTRVTFDIPGKLIYPTIVPREEPSKKKAVSKMDEDEDTDEDEVSKMDTDENVASVSKPKNQGQDQGLQAELLPKSLRVVDGSTDAKLKDDASALSKKAEEHMQQLKHMIDQDALSVSAQTRTDFLKDVTYSQLVDYSMRKDPKITDSRLEPAYQSFLKVLQDPTKDDEDEKIMKKWLKDVCIVFYKIYLNQHKKLYQEDLDLGESRFKTIQDWSKYYAASRFGFIRAPYRSDALRNELIKMIDDDSLNKKDTTWDSVWPII